MKVNFLIVGTQKAGTSVLDLYLREHPEIEMAKVKETHFFDDEKIFETTIDYCQYHQFFNNVSENMIQGEATPIYMYWYNAPKRIWEYNPSMKIIVILRNPIERAFSHWNMEKSKNNEHMSFSEAIRNESERCRQALPFQHPVFSYIDRGFYTEQLRRLWHFFPKQQTLILRHENLKYSLKKTLSKISHFLEIQDFINIKYRDAHSRKYMAQLLDNDRSYLKSIFFYEIKELESILGWKCSDWLDS